MSGGEATSQQAAREGPVLSEGLPLASQPGVEAAVAPSAEIGQAPAAHQLGPVAAVLEAGTFGSAASTGRPAPMEVEPPRVVLKPRPPEAATKMMPMTPALQELITLWQEAQVPDPLM